MSMRAVRLHGSGGADDIALDDVAIPQLDSGEALVRVHAAALTRDELEWPVDRLPAIPSYEVSGVVVDVAPGVIDVLLETPSMRSRHSIEMGPPPNTLRSLPRLSVGSRVHSAQSRAPRSRCRV
jgi:hypothetical protein